MGTFFLGPLCGPLLAPIIGGAIAYAWGWRSTQWFLTIYGGVSPLILRFRIRETLASRKKSQSRRFIIGSLNNTPLMIVYQPLFSLESTPDWLLNINNRGRKRSNPRRQ